MQHPQPHTVVLVEGASDEVALEVLAARRGRDLAAEGVRIVAMGGATNIARHVRRYGPAGSGARIAGLYDDAEERFFARALEASGLAPAGARLDRAALERLGFFVCVADLEDELIRSLGTAGVEEVVERVGHGAALRTFRNQPAQRERPEHLRLRRFMGTMSGRKSLYARALVEHLDLARVPRPLDALLDAV
jgi:hypothetical protein